MRHLAPKKRSSSTFFFNFFARASGALLLITPREVCDEHRVQAPLLLNDLLARS
jgi:hypothetical protein